MPRKISNTGIAISWVISRTFIMACILVIARSLGAGGMSGPAIMFWQNTFAFVIYVTYCLYKKDIPTTQKYKLHLLRCTLGLSSGMLLFYCLPMMSLNKATAITFTGPMFSTIAAMILLREKTTIHRTIGLLVGFVGVLIILRPGTDAFNPISALLLIVPMIWGLTDVTIKKLITTESTNSLLFHMVVIMMVFSIPLGIFFWHTPTTEQWVLCAALALFHLGNFTTISKAFKRADISVLMPFEFFRLIFSSVFAYFIFSESLDMAIVAGSLVIVGSTLYVARKESKYGSKN